MAQLIQQTLLFSEPGRSNTEVVLQLVKKRASDMQIKTILIATTTGATAVQAAHALPALNLIAVTHSTGYIQPNQQELLPEHEIELKEKNVKILTAQHALGGVNRAIRKMLHTYQTDEIIAHTLRIWGQGMKAAIEIALMAADAGLVDVENPVICISGTGRGADTAVILQPTNAQTFFDLKIHEIICRPAAGHPGFIAETPGK
jgi:uncharacterized protein